MAREFPELLYSLALLANLAGRVCYTTPGSLSFLVGGSTVPKKAVKESRVRVQWDEGFILKAYRFAQDGMSNEAICGQFGITNARLRKWRRLHPALEEALTQSRRLVPSGSPDRTRGQGESLADFVYRRLPERLKAVWDKIAKWDKDPSAQKRLDALFAKEGKYVRQHLFMYALVMKSFSASEACRFVGISKSVLNLWMSEPDFCELLDEIRWHKENLVEQALFDLIKRRDAKAVIFASKTLNAGRGYHDKRTVETVGKVQHEHELKIMDSLPLKLRKQVLKAIEARKDTDAIIQDEEVPEAELVGPEGDIDE